MLFCAETRGVDSTRRLPALSAAVIATSRLNAPLIEPSEIPAPLVGAGAPRFTAVLVLFGPWVCVPTRPLAVPLFGNARPVVLPRVGSTMPLNPHWIPSRRA